MAWAGAGLVWTVAGGVPASLGLEAAAAERSGDRFSFVQVSDSHIGFSKPANPDTRATFREAMSKIAALPQRPAFIMHTGDVSQLSKPEEFDDADQIIKEAGLPVFHIPGEHDMLDDGAGKAFLDRYGSGGLAGVIAVPVMTGGWPGHLLSVEVHLRPVLVELGATVPSRGLYVTEPELADTGAAVGKWAETAVPLIVRALR